MLESSLGPLFVLPCPEEKEPCVHSEPCMAACSYTLSTGEVDTGGFHGLLGQQFGQTSELPTQREIVLKCKVENGARVDRLSCWQRAGSGRSPSGRAGDSRAGHR